jgi:lysophospholipase L1-like esterase
MRNGVTRTSVTTLLVALLSAIAVLVPARPASAQVAGTDGAIFANGVVGSGWRFVTDINTGTPIPATNGVIGFVPLSIEGGGALRVSRDASVTGFTQADIVFANAANKSFRVQPFNNGSPAGNEQTITLNASGTGAITVPTSGVNFFYFTGLGTASLTITSMTLRTSGGVSPTPVTTPPTTTPIAITPATTTPPASVGTPAVLLANGVIGSGWRFVTNLATFAPQGVTNGALTFTPTSTEGGGALRISRDASLTGYAQIEFSFANAAGKSFRIQAFNNGSPTGAEQRVTLNSAGVGAASIPSTGVNFFYLTGLGTTPLTLTTLVLRTTALVSPSPSPSPTPTPSPSPTPSPTPTSIAVGGPVATCQSRTGATRIMLTGDSLTSGIYAEYQLRDAYRFELYRLFKASGPNVLFRGPRGIGDSNNPVDDPNFSHAAAGGWTTAMVQAEINNWVTVGDPDVVVLNIGTNDVGRGGQTAAAWEVEIRRLVGSIQRKAPNSVIVVSSLTPGLFEARASQVGTLKAQLNAVIRRIGDELPNDRVLFSDVATRMLTGATKVTDADFAPNDATHFSPTGAAKFAQALRPEVTAAVNTSAQNRCGTHTRFADVP